MYLLSGLELLDIAVGTRAGEGDITQRTLFLLLLPLDSGCAHRLLHLRDVSETLPTSVTPCCCKLRALFQGAPTDLFCQARGRPGLHVTHQHAVQVKPAIPQGMWVYELWR